MRPAAAGALGLSLLALAACGDKEKAKAVEPRPLEAGEKVAGAMDVWGRKLDIDCPRKFDVPARPSGARADDIRGLRLGVGYDTALLYAQCEKGRPLDSVLMTESADFDRQEQGLKIRTMAAVANGAFGPRFRQQDIFDRDPGRGLQKTDAVWRFIADGMPGQEKVYAIWLAQPFAKGEQPTVESQVAGLKAKYGEPTVVEDRGKMVWTAQPDGTPIPAFDRERLRRCANTVDPGHQALNYGPDCGVTVVARVTPDQNPALAYRVETAVFDPAGLWAYQNERFEQERDALLAGQALAQSKTAEGGKF
ncbi:hypothetical protein [Caulobacter mirabilis]|uniref:Lipoprotein n=1 Tax=Caulobacter mirabilis TaxID=69666 RepID=A0A2D2ASP3_9CAUL|nr:hypothetical protein [Caulobacter mirabilis]ATQ41024.1 hypothetical protein CSW64_00685 [Caulobacter mirabilis]